MQLAQLNNKWTSQSGAYEITRFRETPEEIDYYYDQITTKDGELSQALSGFPTLDLSYLMRIFEPQAGTSLFLSFLGFRMFLLPAHFVNSVMAHSERDNRKL
jgi:hypothetical protein